MFYERLKLACAENRIKVTNLVTILGMSGGNHTSWKSGNIPKADTLCKIADCLNISIDYLLGRTDSMAAPARSTDDPTLASIWASCEKLNQEGKEELAKQARLLVASGEYIKTSPSGLVEGQA